MYANVNTKPMQGERFRFMRGHVMGIPEDYNDDIERSRTHPLLLPKIESEKLLATDGEVLEKSAIVVPAKRPKKEIKKRTNVLFPPRAMPSEKPRSMLGERK